MKLVRYNRLYIILRELGLLIFIFLIVYILLNLKIKNITKIEELEINRLKILDSKGNVKILIDTDNNGDPKMCFFDDKRKIRIGILITPKGYAGIGLGDTEEKIRLTLSVKKTSHHRSI